MSSPSPTVAPSKLASIQIFVSRAGFFWRGGAVCLAVVFGISLVVATVLGDVYESESIVEFADAVSARASGGQPESQDERLVRVLLDAPVVERLARELGDPRLEGAALTAAVERTRRSIRVVPRGEHRFAIVFRAPSAAVSQRGSDWLAQVALRAIDVMSEVPSEDAPMRVKALEDRTKDLAAFVAEHPEVALNPPAGASSGGTEVQAPPPADSALVVLQQQRGRLEWRIAEAERKEAAGAGNPYDTTIDRAALQRELAQVRAAIAARQAVALRAGAEASAGNRSSSPATASSASGALKAEWLRLVQAVVDAQLQAPAKREGIAQGSSLRILQRASFPVRPLKPDKRLIGLLGLAAGVWTGIIWAFARVALGHDLRESLVEGDDGGAEGEPHEVNDAAEGERRSWPEKDTIVDAARPSDASQAGAPATVRDGGGWQLVGSPGVLSPPLGSRGLVKGRIPKELQSTEPGVVDVKRVLAQTGTVPNRGSSVNAAPMGDDGKRGEAAAAERNQLGPGAYAQRRDEAATPPVSPDPPRLDVHVSVNPPLANPMPAAIRATGVTQTFASPPAGMGYPPPRAWQASPQPPPAAVRPAAGSKPPAATPTFGLALRSKSPDDVFSLRDVPLGWSPDPAMMQTGSMNELLTLRDQLYQLSAGGCFIVGVTSGPDGTADKSCIAAQLASLLAGAGRARVLLIEANFDRPAVHSLMRVDMPFSQGFSEQMRKRMTPAPRRPWVLFRCAPNLHVLAEGLVRSPGLLSSVQFGEAIAELRGYYDVIVADGPIAESTIDTCAFDALMDGIVLVGAVGSSPSKLLEGASKWFGKKQLMAVISADASAEERIEFGAQTK
jgi:Mrp family chromosome partitioning ATPase